MIVPQNYRLEVELFGRCVLDLETPTVTKIFSISNARILDEIINNIGY